MPLKLHQGKQVEKEELNRILKNLIARIREDAQLDTDDVSELKRSWENYEFPLLRIPNPDDEETKTVEEYLQFFIPKEELKFEFYSKLFILYPGFRKYLSAHPDVLQKLLSNPEARTFIKCVGFFLGLRYLDDLKMQPADAFLYNTLLAVFDGLTAELEFESEELDQLEPPFNTYPLPRPDLINYYKNKKIRELENQKKLVEEENSALQQEINDLKKRLNQKSATPAVAALPPVVPTQPLGRNPLPAEPTRTPEPSQTAATSQRGFGAESTSRRSGSVESAPPQRGSVESSPQRGSVESSPQRGSVESAPLQRGSIVDVASTQRGSFVEAAPQRGPAPIPAPIPAPLPNFLAEEKPVVTKFDRVDINTPLLITITLVGRASGTARNIQVNFNHPRQFTFERTENSPNAYYSYFKPQILGKFTVESVQIDGEMIQDSKFSFEVYRDYRAIAAPSLLKYDGMKDPWGLALFKGELFVSDCHQEVKKIFQFDQNRQFLREFQTPVVNNQKAFPRGIVVTPSGDLVVVCADIGKIQTFSLVNDGKLLLQFGAGIQTGTTLEDGKFRIPRGVCIGFNNDIVIVDSDQHRIQIYSQEGQFIRTFGHQGKKEGQFFFPASVAYQPGENGQPGNLVVTDCDNSRLQILDWNGNPIKTIGGHGLARPSGVAVDPLGNVIVSDLQTSAIFIFDREGNQLITKISGGLKGPRMVAVDPKGSIYVADMGNSRVAIY